MIHQCSMIRYMISVNDILNFKSMKIKLSMQSLLWQIGKVCICQLMQKMNIKKAKRNMKSM